MVSCRGKSWIGIVSHRAAEMLLDMECLHGSLYLGSRHLARDHLFVRKSPKPESSFTAALEAPWL